MDLYKAWPGSDDNISAFDEMKRRVDVQEEHNKQRRLGAISIQELIYGHASPTEKIVDDFVYNPAKVSAVGYTYHALIQNIVIEEHAQHTTDTTPDIHSVQEVLTPEVDGLIPSDIKADTPQSYEEPISAMEEVNIQTLLMELHALMSTLDGPYSKDKARSFERFVQRSGTMLNAVLCEAGKAIITGEWDVNTEKEMTLQSRIGIFFKLLRRLGGISPSKAHAEFKNIYKSVGSLNSLLYSVESGARDPNSINEKIIHRFYCSHIPYSNIRDVISTHTSGHYGTAASSEEPISSTEVEHEGNKELLIQQGLDALSEISLLMSGPQSKIKKGQYTEYVKQTPHLKEVLIHAGQLIITGKWSEVVESDLSARKGYFLKLLRYLGARKPLEIYSAYPQVATNSAQFTQLLHGIESGKKKFTKLTSGAFHMTYCAHLSMAEINTILQQTLPQVTPVKSNQSTINIPHIFHGVTNETYMKTLKQLYSIHLTSTQQEDIFSKIVKAFRQQDLSIDVINNRNLNSTQKLQGLLLRTLRHLRKESSLLRICQQHHTDSAQCPNIVAKISNIETGKSPYTSITDHEIEIYYASTTFPTKRIKEILKTTTQQDSPRAPVREHQRDRKIPEPVATVANKKTKPLSINKVREEISTWIVPILNTCNEEQCTPSVEYLQQKLDPKIRTQLLLHTVASIAMGKLYLRDTQTISWDSGEQMQKEILRLLRIIGNVDISEALLSKALQIEVQPMSTDIYLSDEEFEHIYCVDIQPTFVRSLLSAATRGNATDTHEQNTEVTLDKVDLNVSHLGTFHSAFLGLSRGGKKRERDALYTLVTELQDEDIHYLLMEEVSDILRNNDDLLLKYVEHKADYIKVILRLLRYCNHPNEGRIFQRLNTSSKTYRAFKKRLNTIEVQGEQILQVNEDILKTLYCTYISFEEFKALLELPNTLINSVTRPEKTSNTLPKKTKSSSEDTSETMQKSMDHYVWPLLRDINTHSYTELQEHVNMIQSIGDKKFIKTMLTKTINDLTKGTLTLHGEARLTKLSITEKQGVILSLLRLLGQVNITMLRGLFTDIDSTFKAFTSTVYNIEHGLESYIELSKHDIFDLIYGSSVFTTRQVLSFLENAQEDVIDVPEEHTYKDYLIGKNAGKIYFKKMVPCPEEEVTSIDRQRYNTITGLSYPSHLSFHIESTLADIKDLKWREATKVLEEFGCRKCDSNSRRGSTTHMMYYRNTKNGKEYNSPILADNGNTSVKKTISGVLKRFGISEELFYMLEAGTQSSTPLSYEEILEAQAKIDALDELV